MTRMQMAANFSVPRLLMLVVTLGTAIPAMAVGSGQSGATGRPGGGLCNRCHGPQTYPGIEVNLAGADPVQCFQQVGDGAFEIGEKLLVMDLSTPAVPSRSFLEVSAPEPEEVAVDQTRECNRNYSAPATDPTIDECLVNENVQCCANVDEVCAGNLTPFTPEEEAPPNQCVTGGALYCPVGSVCGANVAGFNIEITGGGTVEPGDDSKFSTPGTDTELTHTGPKPFAGGAVSWQMVYQAPLVSPTGGQDPQSATFYAAVNATNGNGIQDGGDITSVLINGQQVLFRRPGGQAAIPPTCAIAPDCAANPPEGGGELNLTNLSCCPTGTFFDNLQNACIDPAGGCAQTDSETVVLFGGLALLVLAIRRRRKDRA